MVDTDILRRAHVEFRAVAAGQGSPPDDTPLEGVRVRLTPSPRKIEVAAGGIDGVLPTKPTTFTLRSWVLVTDSDGYLINPSAVIATPEYPQGTPESIASARDIEIVASDAVDGMTIYWTSAIDAPDSGVQAISKVWAAPAGEVVDLTTVASVPPSPPGTLAEYLQAVRDARAARDIAVSARDAAQGHADDAHEAAQAAQLAASMTVQATLGGRPGTLALTYPALAAGPYPNTVRVPIGA